MSIDQLVSCPGVLALELTPEQGPSRTAVERDVAERLAAFIAADLRALLPRVEQATLAVVGAHFDSSELLRPGFPVFGALTSLAQGSAGGVLAFGSREGSMPAATLVPEPALRGGSLRVVPWTLLAASDLAGDLVGTMEADLGGKGEVGARTADCFMRAFDTRLEHARYFTPHDLMAMVDVHYEHANLTALWTLVEAALLTPERPETVMSAHGLRWRHADARAIAQTPGAWLAQATTPPDTRAHALAGIVFELRQYAALLQAHRVPLAFDGAYFDADGQFVVDVVQPPDAALPPARLYAHEAAGLGVIALTAAQAGPGHARVLANAWPLGTDLVYACRYLAGQFGCPAEPERLGHVVFDAAGRLSIPV